MVNKREKLFLSNVKFQEGGIISYHRINHTDFTIWKQQIRRLVMK